MTRRIVRGLGAVALTLLFAGPGAAQNGGTVAGQVTDATTQEPLSGVQITVAGTTRSTLTNDDGRYLLTNVPTGVHEVRASRLGYAQGTAQVTVTAGESAVADFSLSTSAVELAGIVVTATGQEQRRREIGNSVSQIDAEDIELAPVQNFTNMLQGRAAGVAILPTSGSLGTGSRIRIRGNSSVSLDGTPLVIVDGIRVSNNTEDTGLFTGGISTSRWEDMNPEDIESIEILKGPAASALYGTAAANGVIQITTRRGQRGSANIRAYAERSTMEIRDSDVPTNYLARGFRSDLGAIGECSLEQRSIGTCTQVDSLYSFNPLLDADQTPLGSGHVDKLGASIAGGSPQGEVTYFVSVESEAGPGVIRDNELDRQSFRANVAGDVGETLRLRANTNYIDSYIQLPQEGNTGSGAWLNALDAADPSPDNVARGGGFRFPYTAENVGWWQNEEELRRFIGSLSADWRPTTWLHVNAVTGVDQANRFEQSTIPVPGLATGFFSEGLREQFRTQDREFTANLNGNLAFQLTDAIASNTALGIQYNETQGDWSYAAGSGLAPGTLATGQALSVQEFYGETKLFGVYGSQQFALNDRLFLTLAIRGDQNSAFGENIGFVTYPAVSGSWVVNEEGWFPELPVLSNLRLRAAYGESGQRPGRLDALRVYESQAVALGGQITSGFVVDNAGNPDLTAEVTSELEFGADLGLFEDRVALELTRWNKNTEDALVLRPLPPSVGGPTSQFFNLGEVDNKGWEAALRLEPVRTEDVGVNLAFTYSTNANELVTYGDSTIPPITFGFQRHVEGYPLGGYWLEAYEYDDANGDGIIQPNEVTSAEDQDDPDTNRSYLGTPQPKREFSVFGDVTFLNMFKLSGLLDHKGGHKIANYTERFRCSDPSGSYCEARQVPGAASLEEQAAIMARRVLGTSAGYIQDADFWKLRELALTFTVPQTWLDRVRYASDLSITLAGRNLKTWTDYRGADPEVNVPGAVGDGTDPGDYFVGDYYNMPSPRIWSIRFNVGF
jgi:TonB-linked SusC/RagA family outer membrane protein